MFLDQVVKIKKQFRPLKINEILVFYFAASVFWHYIFSMWFLPLPNIAYLEYPATAATIVQITKWLDPRECALTGGFFGKNIIPSYFLEIILVTTVLIMTGIGAWASLVFFEAKIMHSYWVYRFWNLVSFDEFYKVRWSFSWLFADMICVAVIGPICEEMVFRGMIFRIFLKRYSVKNAIFFTSVVFSIFHLNRSFLGSFFHSIIFCILVIKFSSLYAPMVAHGLYNFVTAILRSVFGVSLVADSSKIGEFSYWKLEFSLLTFGLLLGSIYVAFVLGKLKNYREPNQENKELSPACCKYLP